MTIPNVSNPPAPPATPNLNELHDWVTDVLYPWMLEVTLVANGIRDHEYEEALLYYNALLGLKNSDGLGGGRNLWDDIKDIYAILQNVRDSHIEHFLP